MFYWSEGESSSLFDAVGESPLLFDAVGESPTLLLHTTIRGPLALTTRNSSVFFAIFCRGHFTCLRIQAPSI